jgi:hypothetical protein
VVQSAVPRDLRNHYLYEYIHTRALRMHTHMIHACERACM